MTGDERTWGRKSVRARPHQRGRQIPMASANLVGAPARADRHAIGQLVGQRVRQRLHHLRQWQSALLPAGATRPGALAEARPRLDTLHRRLLSPDALGCRADATCRAGRRAQRARPVRKETTSSGSTSPTSEADRRGDGSLRRSHVTPAACPACPPVLSLSQAARRAYVRRAQLMTSDYVQSAQPS